MTPDALFDLANLAAIVGWLALLAYPLIPRIADWIGGTAVPLLLAIGYVALVVAFWGAGSGEASFTTLDGVAALFSTREVILAGWVHYLAFDLFAGGWQVREARRLGLPFLAVVPCLALTFVAGPFGLAAFLLLRLALRRRLAIGEPAR